MSEILRILFWVIILTISFTAYLLVVNALFPQRVAGTKEVIRSMAGRSFGIGLVNFAFFAVIAIVLISLGNKLGSGFIKGILIIPAFIIIAIILVMLSFGLAGMSDHIGERIAPDSAAWKRSVWGTVCISLGCALPFAGWFVLFPYLGFVGIGAFILGFFQNKTTPPAS